MKEHSIIYAEPTPCWLRSSRDQNWLTNRRAADDLQTSVEGRRHRRYSSRNRFESVEYSGIQTITMSDGDQGVLQKADNMEEKTGSDNKMAVRGRLYDLWPFTNVSVRVAILNTKYLSPASDVITFMTAESGNLMP